MSHQTNQYIVTFNAAGDQFVTRSTGEAYVPPLQHPPSSVAEFLTKIDEQLRHGAHYFTFAEAQRLMIQFKHLTSISTALSCASDYVQIREIVADQQSTLFKLLQKSTVTERPNSDVFTAAALVAGGFVRPEDYLDSVQELVEQALQNKDEFAETRTALARNLLGFYIQLVLPYAHRLAPRVAALVASIDSQNHLQQLTETVAVGHQKGGYSPVVFASRLFFVVPGVQLHQPLRFPRRLKIPRMATVSPSEYAQFLTAKAAEILRRLDCQAFVRASLGQADAKFDAVLKEMAKLQQDLSRLMQNYYLQDEYSDTALSYVLLLVKQLREQNNFALLRTAILDLTENAPTKTFGVFKQTMANIPQYIINKGEDIPPDSIRSRLVRPQAIDLRNERFVHPSLKTVLEDCLGSCGVKSVDRSVLAESQLKVSEPKQALTEGERILSYRLLFSQGQEAAEAQLQYLQCMGEAAPPSVYDVEFLAFWCQKQFKQYQAKQLNLAEVLSAVSGPICLVANVERFPFAWDDTNGDLLEQLFVGAIVEK